MARNGHANKGSSTERTTPHAEKERVQTAPRRNKVTFAKTVNIIEFDPSDEPATISSKPNASVLCCNMNPRKASHSAKSVHSAQKRVTKTPSGDATKSSCSKKTTVPEINSYPKCTERSTSAACSNRGPKKMCCHAGSDAKGVKDVATATQKDVQVSKKGRKTQHRSKKAFLSDKPLPRARTHSKSVKKCCASEHASYCSTHFEGCTDELPCRCTSCCCEGHYACDD